MSARSIGHHLFKVYVQVYVKNAYARDSKIGTTRSQNKSCQLSHGMQHIDKKEESYTM